MYVNIATQIIEALVSAGQGTKSIVPLMNFQGNMNQDIAEIRVCERIFRKYLHKFGFDDVVIPGIIGNQSSLFPFPQDIGHAFGYINYVAMIAAMTDLAACSVKTIDEATGVPSVESHMQTYRSANWIFNVVRQQKFEPVTAEIELEERMTELAVSAILDKVTEMGDGDIVVGAVKAVEAGVLDSPFSINIYTKDLVMGARDLQGACRYIDYGNLPIPKEVREYNDEKIKEREKTEGIKLSFNASLADFWSLAGGSVVGSVSKEDESEDEPEKIQMQRTPTIITGTVGVDAHVIGTKIVSRVLKEYGFNVVALGAQTPADEFIKVAQETNADAMILSSLYGMAEMDLHGFRDKCIESGIGEIILYIGGILGVGTRDLKEDEATFKKLGFDRVYPPESDIKKAIKDLYKDLKEKGRI
jgi:methylaspartate mutase S subunit